MPIEELNATFADLEAPDLEWEQMAEAPVPRLDGSAIQIKDLLYVLAGYGSLDYVRILYATLPDPNYGIFPFR